MSSIFKKSIRFQWDGTEIERAWWWAFLRCSLREMRELSYIYKYKVSDPINDAINFR